MYIIRGNGLETQTVNESSVKREERKNKQSKNSEKETYKTKRMTKGVTEK